VETLIARTAPDTGSACVWQFPAKTLNGEWRGGTNQSNQSYTRDFYVHVNLRGYNSHLIGKHQR